MPEPARDPRAEQSAAHWDRLYASKGGKDAAWYEESPETSIALVLSGGVPGSVVDVGSGTSMLAEELLDSGVERVTLVDLSMSALALTAARLDERANRVTTVVADVLTHRFDEQFDVWHDRAVFHFLTEPAQRAAYAEQARSAVVPGGLLVIGAFAEGGPEESSGLPVVRYAAEALAAELGQGFVLEESRRVEHHTPWDAVQPFTWVVLRCS